jgi:hypothetical protein
MLLYIIVRSNKIRRKERAFFLEMGSIKFVDARECKKYQFAASCQEPFFLKYNELSRALKSGYADTAKYQPVLRTPIGTQYFEPVQIQREINYSAEHQLLN